MRANAMHAKRRPRHSGPREDLFARPLELARGRRNAGLNDREPWFRGAGAGQRSRSARRKAAER